MRIFLAVCVLAISSGAGRSADEPVDIKIGYLRQVPSKLRLSLIDVPAPNDGLAGAQLAIDDDNATGRFLNQHYTLIEKTLGESDDPVAAMNALADQGVSFIVTSLDADRLLKVADAGQARGEVFINASALDERLREQDCRANVIHVAPTRSMLADALAQYLVWKKWDKWVLLKGSHDKDVLFAEALRHAATRFGAKIVEEREFKDNGGARRTDSGVAEIQRQMPVVTQGITRARRAGRGGRERSVCRLSAISDLGCAARLQARRASFPAPGMRRSINGAPCSCRTVSPKHSSAR